MVPNQFPLLASTKLQELQGKCRIVRGSNKVYYNSLWHKETTNEKRKEYNFENDKDKTNANLNLSNH